LKLSSPTPLDTEAAGHPSGGFFYVLFQKAAANFPTIPPTLRPYRKITRLFHNFEEKLT
jgi:hypothetical protein